MAGRWRDVLVLVLSFVPVGFACSNAQESAPSRTVGVAGTSTSGGAADGGDVDADVDPSCLGAEGCFTCEPTRTIDLLNACTDGQCAPFDNAARLPLFVPGQALPPVL
ncbi:MAG: hypothetical protein KIT84_30200 [Labilithrix sp.]|nr:hypothetical protein [Labilithrix sp.]MCW5815337.1 hypothetical protein [Labilithrix sp.]